jgi:hypothetical protein
LATIFVVQIESAVRSFLGQRTGLCGVFMATAATATATAATTTRLAALGLGTILIRQFVVRDGLSHRLGGCRFLGGLSGLGDWSD